MVAWAWGLHYYSDKQECRMTAKTRKASQPETPSFSPRLYGIGAVVLTIVVAGVFGISRYVALDFARDMQTWQEKLNIIAESRSSDITAYVGRNLKELRTLADNPSLQIYLSEAGQSEPGQKEGSTIESGQKAYLRNLLLFTAERAGFAPASSLPAIHANLPQDSRGGLAVLDKNNEIAVSSALSPSTRDIILAQAPQLPGSGDGLIDIQKDEEGNLYIGFVASVYAVQTEPSEETRIGRIIGIKRIDQAFFALLRHPGNTDKSLESSLLRPVGVDGEKIEYLSPLLDESGPLEKTTPIDGASDAAASLMENPGGFVFDKKDYRQKTVLATSRTISGTPWTLLVKIDRDEALAQSTQRRNSMTIFFFLVIAIIVLVIVAVWWHAHSLRAMMMSHHFRKLAAQATAQEQLLRLVADYQPEPVYIVDDAGLYRFANRKAAEMAGVDAASMIGKTLADMRGAARAAIIAEQCGQARSRHAVGYDEMHLMEAGKARILRMAFVPLEHIPVAGLPENTPGVMVIEQDISDAVHEREERLATHQQLVLTLLRLVDKRDPFAANHSLLVSQIAHEVATEMELGRVMVETTRFAASLMNIGKIIISPELLTKNEPLSADEKRRIQESMHMAAELIADVHFEGPVAETLRQWQEKWDGSGPLGLSGEQILVSARIIAAANAFIGMVSPRSWRTAIPIEQATKFLLDQSNLAFDRRVVVALINYVENHNGRAWIDRLVEDKNRAA